MGSGGQMRPGATQCWLDVLGVIVCGERWVGRARRWAPLELVTRGAPLELTGQVVLVEVVAWRWAPLEVAVRVVTVEVAARGAPLELAAQGW